MDTDEIEYLINNWRCQDVSKLDEGVFRASRWLDEDEPLSFYLAQLEFRNLPQTRRKEVAKLRLKTAARDTSRDHMSTQLRDMFDQLAKILDSVIGDLYAGEMNNDPRVKLRGMYDIPQAPDAVINEKRASAERHRDRFSLNIGDVQDWMKEEPETVTGGGKAYDTVMARWLGFRSHVPYAKNSILSKEDPQDELRLISDKCPVCHEKLRLCECDYCMGCGEIDRDCKCEVCDSCHRKLEVDCRCISCHTCELKYNLEAENGKTSCFCRCDTCHKWLCHSSPEEADYCICGLSPEAFHVQQRHQQEARSAYLARTDRPDWSDQIRNWVHTWIEDKIKDLHQDQGPRVLEPATRALRMVELCGTYQIISSSSRAVKCPERSELVLSHNATTLYGRYSLGREIHGILRTVYMPAFASTEVVQCQWITENFVTKDGKWMSPNALDRSGCDGMDATDGIMFLGNGLIKISPQVLCYKTADHHGDVFLGIKTSNEHDDVTAVREAWMAVMQVTGGSQLSGGSGGQLGLRNLVTSQKAAKTSWDEALVDRYVHRLSVDRPAGNKKLKPKN